MSLTEEQQGAVAFDLEKNRAAIDSAINSLLCEGWDNEASTVRRLVAEIERLRAENEEAQESLTAAYMLGSHEKAHEQAAHISELEVEIAELKADLEQSEICIQARLDVIDQQAARIKSLKKEIRRLKHESKVEQEFTNSYIKRLHDAEARIKELEEAHKRSGAKYAKIINELRSSVYANIPGLDVGKIGPDAKPRSWQITEERVGLLRYCLDTLLDAPDIEESPGPRHSIEMLRAMLTEAE